MLRPILDFFWETTGATAVPCSSAVGTLHDAFVQTADSSSISVYNGSDVGVGQSWQSGSAPSVVSGACVRLDRVGSPSGTYTVGIRAHSGTYGTSSVPTGSDLVTSAEVDVSTISQTVADYWHALGGWTPTASTNYVLTIDGTNVTGDGSNYLAVIVETGAEATHGGNQSAITSSWAAAATQDMAFKVYYRSGGGGATSNNRQRGYAAMVVRGFRIFLPLLFGAM